MFTFEGDLHGVMLTFRIRWCFVPFWTWQMLLCINKWFRHGCHYNFCAQPWVSGALTQAGLFSIVFCCWNTPTAVTIVAAALSSLHGWNKKQNENNSGQFLRFVAEHKSSTKLRGSHLIVLKNWISLQTVALGKSQNTWKPLAEMF